MNTICQDSQGRKASSQGYCGGILNRGRGRGRGRVRGRGTREGFEKGRYIEVKITKRSSMLSGRSPTGSAREESVKEPD